MLKIFKKKRFWIILIVILAAIGYFAFAALNKKPAFEYTTEQVKKGQLTQTVSATGIVESAHEITLNFKNPGKIVLMAAKEGNDVKAGDVLAQIDSAGINAQISQYSANLASAKANLDKVKAGASPQDINLTQEQLTKSQNDYDRLMQESASQIKILREKTVDALNNSVFSIQTALNTVYNDLINSENTIDMNTTDGALQAKVKSNFDLMKGRFADLRLQVDAAKLADGDSSKIISAADAARLYLNDLNSLLDDSYNLSDKIIINTTYTTTKKDTIKADISAQQSSINSALTSLQSARSTLINTSNSYQTQIEAAKNSVAIAQAQLDLKKIGARDFEIASAVAQVAQAQATLDKARSDANDYVIKAPIDGKITKVNYLLGETPNSVDPVIMMLGTERYEIKVDIPESDITKIKLGEKVTIDLDAFGSDHPFNGTVTFIDPAQTIIKDVTYYKTTVVFNSDSWNDQIKPGMTANLTILADQKDDVLYIPQRAVKIKTAALGEVPAKFVEVLVNGQPQEKDIQIGLRGDNGLVEITAGLSEGESVITFTKDNSKP